MVLDIFVFLVIIFQPFTEFSEDAVVEEKIISQDVSCFNNSSLQKSSKMVKVEFAN